MAKKLSVSSAEKKLSIEANDDMMMWLVDKTDSPQSQLTKAIKHYREKYQEPELALVSMQYEDLADDKVKVLRRKYVSPNIFYIL